MVWASAELWIDAKWILTRNGDLRQQAFSFCFVLVGLVWVFFLIQNKSCTEVMQQ